MAIFLTALYIIAFGAAFLETSANPYITILGDPQTASPRLNFAQAFNGVATVLGPLVGGYVIFTGVEYTPGAARRDGAGKRWMPGAPGGRDSRPALSGAGHPDGDHRLRHRAHQISGFAFDGHAAKARARPLRVLRHPRVRYAVMAQFFYVGAQVGTWSLLVDFAHEAANVPERTGATVYLFATMVAFCAGRFFGAWLQRLCRSGAATGALLRLQYRPVLPGRGLGRLSQHLRHGGDSASSCPSCSPPSSRWGWRGLGHETEFASSFIVMAISGAAVVPPLMAWFSEMTGALHWSLFFPAVCYLVVLSFGYLRRKWGSPRHELSRCVNWPTGLKVTELGFGTAPVGNVFRPVADEVARATLATAALAAGFGYYDTAPFYGFGLSERRVGDALRRRKVACIFRPRSDGC